MGRLEPALRDYLFAQAREHGVNLSDAALDDALGFDIHLNSQGLVVWLQQRTV